VELDIKYAGATHQRRRRQGHPMQAQLLQTRRAARDGVHVPAHERLCHLVLILLYAEPALRPLGPAHALQVGLHRVADGLRDLEGLQRGEGVGE
jgi:hypothetical protein